MYSSSSRKADLTHTHLLTPPPPPSFFSDRLFISSGKAKIRSREPRHLARQTGQGKAGRNMYSTQCAIIVPLCNHVRAHHGLDIELDPCDVLALSLPPSIPPSHRAVPAPRRTGPCPSVLPNYIQCLFSELLPYQACSLRDDLFLVLFAHGCHI